MNKFICMGYGSMIAWRGHLPASVAFCTGTVPRRMERKHPREEMRGIRPKVTTVDARSASTVLRRAMPFEARGLNKNTKIT